MSKRKQDSLSCRPNVLIYGSDPTLIETRCWVLESAAFQVQGASRLSEVEGALRWQKVEVVIFCHSLSEEACRTALGITRPYRPALKHLILSPELALACGSEEDAVLSSVLSPYALVDAVRALTVDASLLN